MSWNNQKGMTLVEVMIAGGLLAGLAVAGMTMFKSQNVAQKTVEQNYEVTATLGAIRTILADRDNCKRNLGGLNPNPTTTTYILTSGIMKVRNGVDQPPVVYVPNTNLPGTSLKINNYRLSKGYSNLGATETMLAISFSRGRQKDQVLKDEITKTIKINYTADGSGNIDSCYAVTSGHSDSLWQIATNMSDIFYNSGRVGIGTSTPQTIFEVYTPGASGSSIRVGGHNFTLQGVNDPVAYGPRLPYIQWLMADNTRAMYMGWGNTTSPGRFINMALENGFSLAIGGGNVGIGTGSPTQPLEVIGNVDITSDGTSGIGFTPAVGARGGSIMTISGADRNTAITINSIGNVGIGTAVPNTKFVISDSTNPNQMNITDNGSDWGLILAKNNSTQAVSGYHGPNWAHVINYDAAPLVFGTGNRADMTIDGTGNVGIGITTPTTNVGSGKVLHIHNPGTSASTVHFTNNTTGALGSDGFIVGKWSDGAYGSGALIWNYEATPITFATSAAERMIITATGNVGVGNIAPAHKLDVTGTVHATNYYVNTQAFASSDASWIRLGDLASGDGLRGTIIRSGDLDRVYFTTAGDVGIGTATPAHKLHVIGNIQSSGTIYATSFVYSSDKRLKQSISLIENPLEKVSKLKGVNFSWKKDGKADVGFIAQDVEKVEPVLVHTDKKGMKSVKYGNIVAIVVEAIKELKVMVLDLISGQNELKAEMVQVKQENELLRKRLDEQEARMKRQEALLSELAGKK